MPTTIQAASEVSKRGSPAIRAASSARISATCRGKRAAMRASPCRRLVKICRKGMERNQLAAARELLDHGYGRPLQMVDVSLFAQEAHRTEPGRTRQHLRRGC